MRRSSLKLPLLFLFSILLPAAVLAYLSVQSLRDEREKALEDQRWIGGSLQAEFDGAVARQVEYIGDAVMEDPQRYGSERIVRQFFILDREGSLVYPYVEALRLSERRPAFRALLSSGETEEFQKKDCAAAVLRYRAAEREAQSPQERAEVLLALARCAWRSGDLEEAQTRYGQLTQFYSDVFDADGMHIATLAYLRLAELRGADDAVQTLLEFTEGVRAGRYPIYPGFGHYLTRAKTLVLGLKGKLDDEALSRLFGDLSEIEALIEFVDLFSDILKTGVVSGTERGYLTGMTSEDESYLAVLQPRSLDDSGVPLDLAGGLLFDLAALADALVRTPAGARLDDRGFELRLFNAAYEPTFRRGEDTDMLTVMDASAVYPGLKMGIYAGDSSKAVAYYRRRNFLVLSVIIVLAVSIGLGGYMIIRDTVREMKLSRLRAEFVSNVSHELKTPLTSIRMYAETLLDGRYRDRDEMTDYLRTLMSESQRLSRLVGNVLDFSRMEEGRKTYDFRTEDLGEIVRSTMASFEYMLRENGFAFEVDVPEGLPSVYGDREGLSAALSNLISNAVKYSFDVKEIRVSVSDRGDSQTIEVSDRGVGIPEMERKRIFEKFYRVEDSRVGAGGTGLGLSLVKSIMEAHGGSVEVEGRVGGGSVFRLIVPKGRGDAVTR